MSTHNELIENILTNDNSQALFLDSLNCIDRNDSIRLQDDLEKLPIDKLSDNDSSKLLDTLLDQCRQSRSNFNLVHVIFKQWIGRVYPKIQEMQFFTSLFFDYNIGIDNLKYLGSVLLNESFFSIAEDMSKYDIGDSTLFACSRLDETYPNQSNYTYKTLVELCFQLKNETMKDYFMQNVKDTSDFAPIPTWIIKNVLLDSVEVSKKVSEKKQVKLTPKVDTEMIKKLTDLIISHVKDNTYFSVETDINQVKEKLTNNFDHLLTSGNENVISDKYLEFTRDQLQQDPELFRMLGPANPGVNYNSDQLQLGGPRMLKGGQWDFNDDDEYVPWFRGNCDQCGLRIRKKCFALRKPVKEGDWINCFCSFPCMKKHQEVIECTSGNPDLITRNLIDNIEEKINKIGIYDRS